MRVNNNSFKHSVRHERRLAGENDYSLLRNIFCNVKTTDADSRDVLQGLGAVEDKKITFVMRQPFESMFIPQVKDRFIFRNKNYIVQAASDMDGENRFLMVEAMYSRAI